MELWAIGYPTTVGGSVEFAGDASAPCLADDSDPAFSAFEAYEADIDDTFILDREGQVRVKFSAALMSLESSDNRDKVDGWMRELL